MQTTSDYIRLRCVEDGGCWIWQLACSSNGTPKVTMGAKPDRKQWAVRRYVAHTMGKNIAGKLVTNTCGNPLCVCPDHLLIVTKKQMADLIVKRTGHPYRVERRKKISDSRRAAAGKLTPEIVREIRASTSTLKAASEQFKVAKTTICRIRRHEAWKDYASPFAGLWARL